MVAALVFGAAGPAIAQSEKEAELLSALALADPEEAAALDLELQALWRRSGSSAMDFLLRRGEQALEQGALAEAVEHLTALVDHDPSFAAGWFRRAEAYARLDLFGPAVADLERALYLNPNNYNALMALGLVFEHFRDPAKAYDAYARAKAIHPHHDEVTKSMKRLAPLIRGRKL